MHTLLQNRLRGWFGHSKAFGRIDFCKLFREMIKRKLPPLVIRLIMEMYEKQSVAVRWNNGYSDSFGVSNEVNGILFPILFCIGSILTTC